jgi:hypothetical protein
MQQISNIEKETELACIHTALQINCRTRETRNTATQNSLEFETLIKENYNIKATYILIDTI